MCTNHFDKKKSNSINDNIVDNNSHFNNDTNNNMMTSSNGNIFRVTGPLCGEFTGDRWIPHTKASDAELWCFLWSAWINGWVNNCETGDLRPYRAHYDVIVVKKDNESRIYLANYFNITGNHWSFLRVCIWTEPLSFEIEKTKYPGPFY